MAMNFTPHQQQAIEVDKGNMLVSAAAGSGKTAVLTERVMRLLTQRNIPADKIVVVTYTVLAAEEMRRRINEKLSAKLLESPDNEALQNQQLLLANAHISTIHSLCASLIRDHFQTLELSENAKIADQTRLLLLQRDAISETLEAHYSSADATDFLELLLFVGGKGDTRLTAMLLSLYEFIRSFAFPLEFLTAAENMLAGSLSLYENAWADGVFSHIGELLSHSVTLYQKAISLMEGDDVIYEKYAETFLSEAEGLKQACLLFKEGSPREGAELLRAHCAEKTRLPVLRKPENPDLVAMVQDIRKRAKKFADDATMRFLSFSEEDFSDDKELSLPQIQTLFSLLREVYARIEEKKRELDLLDYSDLEHYALKLLIKSGERGYEKSDIAKELSEQFETVMVDECQDINEVQNLIFTLLSRDETNLYMVGDVKQSIYRFRQACPAIFTQKKKHFSIYNPESHENDTAVIQLETNFRSRVEVCDTVNCIFSRLMSERMGEIEYNESEKLTVGAEYPLQESAAPELYILDYNNENETDKAVAEAGFVAKRIQQMMAEGYIVTQKGGSRPCEYRDFAVLLRKKKDIAKTYADILSEHGVPCISDSTEGYFGEYEITVMLNLLRIIDNPFLDVPLLSVLLSPVFGFCADTVTEIRLHERKKPLYQALMGFAATNPQCREFIELLSHFRQKAALLSTPALLQEIYDRTDFTVLSGAASGSHNSKRYVDSERKSGNLRLLLQYAAKYEEFGTNGLSGFLRYIDRVMESKQDFSCVNINSANANAVSIMSIHGSKGLEFPICIIADCDKGFNKQDINTLSFQMNAQLGFAMKINKPSEQKSYSSFPYEAIRLCREQEMLSEELRVLYVALTRAKEKLIMVMSFKNAERRITSLCDYITGTAKPSPFAVYTAKSFADWLLLALLPHPAMRNILRGLDRWNEADDLARPSNSIESIDSMNFPLKAELISLLDEANEAKLDKLDKLAEQDGIESDTTFPQDAPFGSDTTLEYNLLNGFEFAYPGEPLTHIPAKLTVTELAKQQQSREPQLKIRPDFMGKDGFTPAERGTLLHRFMQFANFEKAGADLKTETERMLKLEYFTDDQVNALDTKKLTAFLNGALCQRIMKSEQNQKCRREYKFNFFLPASEIDNQLEEPLASEKILIQGIADCILFEPNGIVLIDYKTDTVTDEATFIARYYNQIRLYKKALEETFSLPVSSCLLYSLYLNKEISVKTE